MIKSNLAPQTFLFALSPKPIKVSPYPLGTPAARFDTEQQPSLMGILLGQSMGKTKGYVYLLEAESGLYKIGVSIRPHKRISEVKRAIPSEDLLTLCLIPTPDMFRLESDLHYRFVDKRVKGEWFKLEREDVQYITSLSYQFRHAR
jgi:hypothetical protein